MAIEAACIRAARAALAQLVLELALPPPPKVLTMSNTWTRVLLCVAIHFQAAGCDPEGRLPSVYGDFKLEPHIYCSGDDITFEWDLTDITHLRVVGATARTIVEGSPKERLVGQVDASDMPLDVLVVWKGDGKEYSARRVAPTVAIPTLTMLNINNDTWMELAGDTLTTFDTVDGAWNASGDGDSLCCPRYSCISRGNFTFDGTTVTVDPNQACRARFLSGDDCHLRGSTREQMDSTSTLTSTTFRLKGYYSQRVRLLGLRNNIGAPFSGASASAAALGLSSLPPGGEVQFSPAGTASIEIDVQTGSPLVLVQKHFRDTFFVQSDPLSEECPQTNIRAEPDCTRRNGYIAHPELCPGYQDVHGLVGLLRCLP